MDPVQTAGVSLQDTYPTGQWPSSIARWWPRCLDLAATQPWLPNEQAECALVVLTGIQAESGGNPNAVGDNGHSIGLFQMHDQGAGFGLTVEERENPEIQFKYMGPRYLNAFAKFWAAGFKGPDLAIAVCGEAERPADPTRYGSVYSALRKGVSW